MEYISIPISLVSLAVSLGTFWIAFIHRGQLKMTMPTIVFFGYDMIPHATPKVFLRTLLYSTATRGHVIEGMFIEVSRDSERSQVFSFWGYGEGEKLTAGSGLHVGRTGIAANHHFVLSIHEDDYRFEAGEYDIIVLASVVGRKNAVQLATIRLTLGRDLAGAIARYEGVLFERNPSGEYVGHIR